VQFDATFGPTETLSPVRPADFKCRGKAPVRAISSLRGARIRLPPTQRRDFCLLFLVRYSRRAKYLSLSAHLSSLLRGPRRFTRTLCGWQYVMAWLRLPFALSSLRTHHFSRRFRLARDFESPTHLQTRCSQLQRGMSRRQGPYPRSASNSHRRVQRIWCVGIR